MAVPAWSFELPVRRTQGRPSIHQRQRERPDQSRRYAGALSSWPGDTRRPRHRPAWKPALTFSPLPRHGFRPGPGLPVRQAAGGAEIRRVAPSARIRDSDKMILSAPKLRLGSPSCSDAFRDIGPRPDEMMMHSRAPSDCCCRWPRSHSRRDRRTNWVFGGSVSRWRRTNSSDRYRRCGASGAAAVGLDVDDLPCCPASAPARPDSGNIPSVLTLNT